MPFPHLFSTITTEQDSTLIFTAHSLPCTPHTLHCLTLMCPLAQGDGQMGGNKPHLQRVRTLAYIHMGAISPPSPPPKTTSNTSVGIIVFLYFNQHAYCGIVYIIFIIVYILLFTSYCLHHCLHYGQYPRFLIITTPTYLRTCRYIVIQRWYNTKCVHKKLHVSHTYIVHVHVLLSSSYFLPAFLSWTRSIIKLRLICVYHHKVANRYVYIPRQCLIE